jgi:hypothetical protein
MGIPIGLRSNAAISGATVKHVVCESCGTEYVYAANRRGGGTAVSFLFLDNEGARERSQRNAAKALEKQLAEAVDPVPCPKCSCYQAAMVAELKKKHVVWLGLPVFLSVVGFVATLVWLLIVVSDRRWNFLHKDGHWALFGVGVSVCAFFVFWGLQTVLARNYEPNDDPLESRQSIAAARALLRSEYDERVAEHNAKTIPAS